MPSPGGRGLDHALRERLKARVADVQKVLGRHVSRTRELLGTMLAGKAS